MARTVVGIFDNESDARDAMQRMQNEGIQSSNIDISTNRNRTGSTSNQGSSSNFDRDSNNPDNRRWDSRSAGMDTDDTPGAQSDMQTNPEFNRSSAPGVSPTGNRMDDDNTYSSKTWNQNQSRTNTDHTGSQNKENEGFFDKVGNFFSNLFGNEDDAHRYTNASRNRTIVTVHATNPTEAEDAADIMDECGAIDTNQPSNMGHTSTSDYKTSSTDTNTNTGAYNRGTTSNRRSHIFERPVESQYRLNSDYNDTDRDESDFSDQKPLL